MCIDEIWTQIESTVAKGSKNVLQNQESLFFKKLLSMISLFT